jgi:hypothetical protein
MRELIYYSRIAGFKEGKKYKQGVNAFTDWTT